MFAMRRQFQRVVMFKHGMHEREKAFVMDVSCSVWRVVQRAQSRMRGGQVVNIRNLHAMHIIFISIFLFLRIVLTMFRSASSLCLAQTGDLGFGPGLRGHAFLALSLSCFV